MGKVDLQMHKNCANNALSGGRGGGGGGYHGSSTDSIALILKYVVEDNKRYCWLNFQVIPSSFGQIKG